MLYRAWDIFAGGQWAHLTEDLNEYLFVLLFDKVDLSNRDSLDSLVLVREKKKKRRQKRKV